ncbi:MAG: helix-turn-helix transcriptional regulator [Planctomycetota bacterium]
MIDAALDFCQTGYYDRFDDGLIHRKVCPFIVIVQTLKGLYQVQTADESADIPSGDVFVVLSNTPMTISHHHRNGGMASQWLHARWLTYGGLDISACLKTPLRLRGKTAASIGKKISELLEIQTDDRLVASARRASAAYHILADICDASTVHSDVLKSIDRLPVVKQALSEMARRIGEPLTVNALARHAFLSPSRFYEVFRSTMNCTPKECIRSMKMSKACDLLTSTTFSVSEIADKLGYGSPHNFSRDFKKRYAVSPLTYRRQHTNLVV